MGGEEGSDPNAGSAAALTRAIDAVDVVAICGRNRRLRLADVIGVDFYPVTLCSASDRGAHI
jgi:hypothetical protein